MLHHHMDMMDLHAHLTGIPRSPCNLLTPPEGQIHISRTRVACQGVSPLSAPQARCANLAGRRPGFVGLLGRASHSLGHSLT